MPFIRKRRWIIQLSLKASKSHIIVKGKYQNKAKQIFQGSKITIITEGHRNLVSVIGSRTFKERCIKELVLKWCDELTKLSEIARTQPQTTFAAFTCGYKHKFSYFMRLYQQLNCINNLMTPVEKITKEKFTSALFDGFPILKEFRKLFSFPFKLRRMCVIDPTGMLTMNTTTQEK